MKLAALISGGKDSLYALKQTWEEHKVVQLISIQSEPGSKFFHQENIQLVKLQAKALNLPLTYRKTPEQEELDVLESTVGKLKDQVDGVVCGAIASNYQKEKLKEICDRFGLKCVAPLWHVDEEKFIQELLEEGFKVVVTKVAAQGLDKNWLGRRLDKDGLEELKDLREKYGIHLAGEGGEYETLVLDCPLFEKRLEIVSSRVRWDSKTRFGILEVEAELREK